MDDRELLARQFETHRAHLRAVAYRMLGAEGEAEDAVQEAWLRLAGADAGAIENLRAWLTTVVARVCLDTLRARRARREESLESENAEPVGELPHDSDPERDALLADSVGMALLIVLDTLSPPERVAFVLHDMFDLSFEEIAPIVNRTPAAARQLASRARRRVREKAGDAQVDRERRRDLVEAFIAASKSGDLEALVAVLDPDVVFRGDAAAVKLGGPPELRGARAVGEAFLGRARAARAGLIDGAVGIHVPVGGRMLLVLRVGFAGGRIATLDAVADRATLDTLDLVPLEG